MANIYDKAHDFVATLVKEESYIKLKELSTKINNDGERFEKIRNYQIKQYELYARNDSGEEIPETEVQAIKAEYESLLQDPEIKQLFEAEYAFGILITDLYKIINDPIKELAPRGPADEE
jgi:cell fate (sporulation/competence/biofilm development) regulator YlbF (YheA/YmcA/DUF963 family)